MDDILEILNMPSWSDIGGLRNQLEATGGASEQLGNTAALESSSGNNNNNNRQQGEFPSAPQVGGFLDFTQENTPFNQIQVPLTNTQQQMGENCNMITAPSSFPMLHHPGSSNLADSQRMWPPRQQQQQPYIGDVQHLLKPDNMYVNSSNPLFSARYRSGAIPSNLRLHGDGARRVINGYGLGQQKPPLQTGSRGSYRNSQSAPVTPMSGAPRPRVRARRGQATDPHSIAERQRRERIADRMKELQGLVPNANKTDKAIMLDEIIEYVKFLQIQSKIFSLCRGMNSSSSPPILPPSEYSSAMASSLSQSSGASAENLESLEREVARLMEENTGKALQFLQSKGFCIMPVSMAAAWSATKAVHQPIYPGDKTESSTIITERPATN